VVKHCPNFSDPEIFWRPEWIGAIHFLASQSTEDLRKFLKILIKSPDPVIFFDSRVEAYRHKAESFHPLTAGFTGHQVT
jgi:predicted glycosyltransferase